MNVVNELSQILIHFLYGDTQLEIYQQSIIEFFAIATCICLAFITIRFVLKCFSGIFIRY